jgi:predicted NACHT family NTPase
MFVDELKKPEHKGLRELATTPILLNLLCLNFDETLTFPIRKSEIYQEAIDALLKKWDSSRNIRRDEIYHGLSIYVNNNCFR